MNNFSSSNLHPAIIEVLSKKGIEKPTEIQALSIPVLLNHSGDFAGRSATGTGKTYAFGSALLTKVDVTKGTLQAIVLVPTRELCDQVGKELNFLASGIDGLLVESIYGGTALKDQIHALSNGVQVVVATPGRMMDLVNRKVVDMSSLDLVVFDEADEMLLKGFSTDIDKILSGANRSYSTWLFSATMPNEIKGIIKKYLNKDLQRVSIGEEKETNEDITHQLIQVTPEQKFDVLMHFLTKFDDGKKIIFCRTKSGTQKLYKQLSALKISSGAIHGDLPQGLRNKVMDQFKEGHISILIATDVASRGVDIADVNHVIQYHMPDTTDSYTHRSGRTSRAGNKGINLTFVFQEELEKFTEIKTELGLKVKNCPLPSQKDQLVNNAVVWSRRIAKEKPVGDKLDDASKALFKSSLVHMSKDEILEKLLATYLREHQG